MVTSRGEKQQLQRQLYNATNPRLVSVLVEKSGKTAKKVQGRSKPLHRWGGSRLGGHCKR
jgi:hypothetical protein